MSQNSPYSSDNPKLERRHLLLLRDALEWKAGLYIADNRLGDIQTAFAAILDSCSTEIDASGLWLQLTSSAKTDSLFFSRLISQLTVKETHFFRYPADFAFLRERVLPDLIAKRRETTRHIHLWSAGCATGEEAYSLAITLANLVDDPDSWDLAVFATDIDPDALEIARRGVYGQWSFRGVPAEILAPCFETQGELFAIHDRYRRLVTFQQHNFVEDDLPVAGPAGMDVIFCRNVFMYFRPQTVAAVSNRFYAALAEDGLLVVGHAEHSPNLHHRFRQETYRDNIVYRKGSPNRRLQTLSLHPTGSDGQGIAKKDSLTAMTRSESADRQAPGAASQTINDPSSLLAAAKQAYKAGNYSQADRSLKGFLSVCPESHEAALLSARNQANLGRLDLARQWCQKAMKLNPLDAEAPYFLAIVDINENRYAEAAANLRRAIYLNAGMVAAHYELGNCLKELRQWDAARKAYDTVSRLLAASDDAAEVPLSDGLVVGQLRRAIERELAAYEKEGRAKRVQQQ